MANKFGEGSESSAGTEFTGKFYSVIFSTH